MDNWINIDSWTSKIYGQLLFNVSHIAGTGPFFKPQMLRCGLQNTKSTSSIFCLEWSNQVYIYEPYHTTRHNLVYPVVLHWGWIWFLWSGYEDSIHIGHTLTCRKAWRDGKKLHIRNYGWEKRNKGHQICLDSSLESPCLGKSREKKWLYNISNNILWSIDHFVRSYEMNHNWV